MCYVKEKCVCKDYCRKEGGVSVSLCLLVLCCVWWELLCSQAANNCWSFPTTSDQEHLMAKKGKQLKNSMK